LQVTLLGKGEKIEISRRQSIRFKELLSLWSFGGFPK
jgi:hypothetical protein